MEEVPMYGAVRDEEEGNYAQLGEERSPYISDPFSKKSKQENVLKYLVASIVASILCPIHILGAVGAVLNIIGYFKLTNHQPDSRPYLATAKIFTLAEIGLGSVVYVMAGGLVICYLVFLLLLSIINLVSSFSS